MKLRSSGVDDILVELTFVLEERGHSRLLGLCRALHRGLRRLFLTTLRRVNQQ